MRKQQLFYSVYRSVYRLFHITYGGPIKKIIARYYNSYLKTSNFD